VMIGAAMTPWAHQLELLQTIPGVGLKTAQVIIAETGADMAQFPTAAHLAVRAGSRPRCTSRPASAARPGPGGATSGWRRCWSKPAARCPDRSRRERSALGPFRDLTAGMVCHAQACEPGRGFLVKTVIAGNSSPRLRSVITRRVAHHPG